MKDQDKSKEQLIDELQALRNKFNKLKNAQLERVTELKIIAEIDRKWKKGELAPEAGFFTLDIETGKLFLKSFDLGVDPFEEAFDKNSHSSIQSDILDREQLNFFINKLEVGEARLFRTRARRCLMMTRANTKESPDGTQTVRSGYADMTAFHDLQEMGGTIVRDMHETCLTNAFIEKIPFMAEYHLRLITELEISKLLLEMAGLREKLAERQEKLAKTRHESDLDILSWSICLMLRTLNRSKSNAPTFIKDEELKYTYVSPAMAKMLRLSQSELLGKTDLAVFGEPRGVFRERKLWNNGAMLQLRELTPGSGVETGGDWLLLLSLRYPILEAETTRGFLISPKFFDSGEADQKEAYQDQSKAMRKAKNIAIKVAKLDTTVLLTGETGVGKDRLAKYIHEHSKRVDGPYLSIPCPNVDSQLAESELFGHEKGAFTGAYKRKRGQLELANGGTIVLNEIGDASDGLQAKLLQFLQTKRFTRVGGEKEIPVDVRLIAATNKNLEEEVESGRFRKDLYYRLNVFPIHIPPLRERKDDIPVLLQEVLRRIQEDPGLPYVADLAPTALSEARDYAWPGNVREMENLIVRTAILSESPFLRIDYPKASSKQGTESPQVDEPQDTRPESGITWSVAFPPDKNLEESAKDMKRWLINKALRHSGGNQSKAAPLLHISRDALNKQIKTLKISVAKGHTSGEDVSDSHSEQ